jgi:oxygen-independent coproporphyrinogen-3 oxidase
LGFVHYEVSNFAKPGFECRHNLKYWNREEYLGLGLGAHSFIDDQVSENQDNFEKYLANPLSPKEQFKLAGDLAEADYIMLALRKQEGINLKKFSQIFSPKTASELIKKSDTYVKSGHLSFNGNHLSPTLKGWLILDKIIRDLI